MDAWIQVVASEVEGKVERMEETSTYLVIGCNAIEINYRPMAHPSVSVAVTPKSIFGKFIIFSRLSSF
jgi:hypothetical protein